MTICVLISCLVISVWYCAFFYLWNILLLLRWGSSICIVLHIKHCLLSPLFFHLYGIVHAMRELQARVKWKKSLSPFPISTLFLIQAQTLIVLIWDLSFFQLFLIVFLQIKLFVNEYVLLLSWCLTAFCKCACNHHYNLHLLVYFL